MLKRLRRIVGGGRVRMWTVRGRYWVSNFGVDIPKETLLDRERNMFSGSAIARIPARETGLVNVLLCSKSDEVITCAKKFPSFIEVESLHFFSLATMAPFIDFLIQSVPKFRGSVRVACGQYTIHD